MTGVVDCLMQGNEKQSAEYWKAESEVWKARYECTRAELEEFTGSSRDLEHELEEELNQYKLHNTRLKIEMQALTEENRSLKDKEQRNSRRIAAMEDQIKTYDAQKQSHLSYRRELEQKNDEMETAYRNLTASLADHTKRIEELIEVKALLENELEQKRCQKEIEQRLRDELKDLQDELAARQKSDSINHGEMMDRRRTMDESILDSDHEITRLRSLASGNFEKSDPKPIKNFDVHSPKENTKLSTDKGSSIIHSLVRKITTLETKLLTVQNQQLSP